MVTVLIKTQAFLPFLKVAHTASIRDEIASLNLGAMADDCNTSAPLSGKDFETLPNRASAVKGLEAARATGRLDKVSKREHVEVQAYPLTVSKVAIWPLQC